MDDRKRKALREARELERRGEIDAAVQKCLQVGALFEAATILARARRDVEAGNLLMSRVGVKPADVGSADDTGKKCAMRAAIFFKRGGRWQVAVELFLALGEYNRAIHTLQEAGDPVGAARLRSRLERSNSASRTGSTANWVGGQALSIQVAQNLERRGQLEAALQAYVQLKMYRDAARVAMRLRRKSEAAELYVEAEAHYEAALIFLSMGDVTQCIENYLRVDPIDRNHRRAAMDLTRLMAERNLTDPRIEACVAEFLDSGPETELELELFYLVGDYFTRRRVLDKAKAVYRLIVLRSPNFRDVKSRLATLERAPAASPLGEGVIGAAVVVRPGKPKYKRTPTPPLPDLPEAPDLDAIVAPSERSAVYHRPPGGASTTHDFIELPDLSEPLAADAGSKAHPTDGAVPPPAPLTPGRFPPLPVVAGGPSATAETTPPSSATPSDIMASELESGLEPGVFARGAVVASRYRLEGVIGRGGMATVFEATDLELQERVALKVFQQRVQDSNLLARFRRELRFSRRLIHKNIIRLYDIGLHKGYRYISMELLVGHNMHELMNNPVGDEPGLMVPVDEGLNYLIQACAGLQAVHDHRVVHRDVKPANLFVTEQNVVKLMDFGIAKDPEAQGLTIDGLTAGTPEYMSPEQGRRFSEVTYATDLYALGVTAYQMLTGTLPFYHCDVIPLLMMHASDPAEPLRARNPDLAEDLEVVVMRLLSKEPSQRYRSARELAENLELIRYYHCG